MKQTQSEPQIFIKVIPDSLYRSFTTLDVEIYPNQKINSYSLIIPDEHDNDIISVEIEKRFLKTFSPKRVIIHNLRDDKINFKLKIDKAVEDSGDVKFPLIYTTLRMNFCLEVKSETLVESETPYCNIRVQILIPENCKGYDDDSRIKIGTEEFDYNDHEKLTQLTDGYPKTNISYYTQNVGSKNKRTEVEIETYYFPAPLPFIPSLLLPPVSGFLILTIFAYDFGLAEKYPITISIFAIVFAIWYKVAPIGMNRVPSYLNLYYIFWMLILILCTVFIVYRVYILEVLENNLNNLIFLMYAILTIVYLLIFYRFYSHPRKKLI